MQTANRRGTNSNLKWAAQSHALSARPRAKRPGKFLKFEFLNLRGNQGTLPLVRLAATCALSAHVINSGEFSKLPNASVASQEPFYVQRLIFFSFLYAFTLPALLLSASSYLHHSLVLFHVFFTKPEVSWNLDYTVSLAGIGTLSSCA